MRAILYIISYFFFFILDFVYYSGARTFVGLCPADIVRVCEEEKERRNERKEFVFFGLGSI